MRKFSAKSQSENKKDRTSRTTEMEKKHLLTKYPKKLSLILSCIQSEKKTPIEKNVINVKGNVTKKI